MVTWAALAVSPHVKDRKGAASSFYSLRRKSVGFAQAWDDAIEEANDNRAMRELADREACL